MSKTQFMYDLAVIGAGSGGVRAARIAGSHGAKVALIELSMNHGPPTYTAAGGTCVNVGCVPKKLMVYGSSFRHSIEDAHQYGWNTDPANMKQNWRTLMDKKDKEISRLNGIYSRMLGNAGVEIIVGKGSLLPDRHTVKIDGKQFGSEDREISAETILICTGGWPFKPEIPGIEHAITSNECFYLEERPERLLVVGGGYIATEFAGIFHGLGSHVIQAYRGDLFLKGFDLDMRNHLAGEMRQAGIDLRFNTNPKSIEKQADGTFEVAMENGDKVVVDCVMYGTGRKPKTSGIGLEEAGVTMTPSGVIPVNDYSRTNVENIYAVGDVTDRLQLTPVALHEGHCFADTVYGGMDRTPDHEFVASAVFSQPEIGTVGYTESQAAEKFQDIVVYKSSFRPMMHTLTGRQTKILMKLIVDEKTNKVVGAHMCGEHAAEIFQTMAVAMKMGATKADFDRTIGIHPSAAEEFVTMRTPAYKYKNGEKVC